MDELERILPAPVFAAHMRRQRRLRRELRREVLLAITFPFTVAAAVFTFTFPDISVLLRAV